MKVSKPPDRIQGKAPIFVVLTVEEARAIESVLEWNWSPELGELKDQLREVLGTRRG